LLEKYYPPIKNKLRFII